MASLPFRERFPPDARREQARKVRAQAAGHVPCICEPHPRASPPLSLPHAHYLIDGASPLLRLRETLRADAALALPPLLCLAETGAPLPDRASLASLDAAHASADGFLYLHAAPHAAPPRLACAAAFSFLRALLRCAPRTTSLHNAPPLAMEESTLSSPPAGQLASPQLASPHGARFAGVSAASCTFLNPRGREAAAPPLRPSRAAVPSALLLASFLDMTAVGLVVPMLSTYSRQLDGSALFTGVLQATYGGSQLLGAHLLGGLSDAVGRRRVLQLSALGGMCGYACLVAAVGERGSLALLLASRVPIGLLKQSLTVARATIVDCTTPSSRMRPMARLGATVGAGFVLGPAVGGVLWKKISPRAPAIVSVALFALVQLVVSLMVPETAPLPLCEEEMRALAAAARRRVANGAPLAPSDASAAAARLVGEWRPNGAPLLPHEAETALAEWRARLAALADGSTDACVSCDDFELSLRRAYAQFKETHGMLPPGGAAQLEGATHARAARRRGGVARGVSAALSAAGEARSRLLAVGRMHAVPQLLAARAMVEMSVGVMHAVFSEYTRRKFGWGPMKIGFGMSYTGLLSVLTDLVLMPVILRAVALTELKVALLGAGLIGAGLSVMLLAIELAAFLIGLALVSFGASLFKAAASTLLLNRAPRDQAGLLSGALDAVEAVCRIATPLAGGYLLHSVSHAAPLALGVALCLTGAAALNATATRPAKPKLQ